MRPRSLGAELPLSAVVGEGGHVAAVLWRAENLQADKDLLNTAKCFSVGVCGKNVFCRGFSLVSLRSSRRQSSPSWVDAMARLGLEWGLEGNGKMGLCPSGGL